MVNRTGNTVLGNFTIFYRFAFEKVSDMATTAWWRDLDTERKSHTETASFFKTTMSTLRGELEAANAVRAKYGCTRARRHQKAV